MPTSLQLLATLFAAITMGLALAHALEFPGKLRLTQEQYLAAQPIYYPGFTVAGGISEPGIVIVLALMLVYAPSHTQFWLIAAALAAFLLVQLIFWLVTQPVNKFWFEGRQLGRTGRRFFGLAPRPGVAPNWTALRDRWEWSHVYRAASAIVGFLLLVLAITL